MTEPQPRWGPKMGRRPLTLATLIFLWLLDRTEDWFPKGMCALGSEIGGAAGIPKWDDALAFSNQGQAMDFQKGQRPRASHKCGGPGLRKGAKVGPKA